MKFSDKLFFTTSAVMTIIFTIFGSWMIASFFQKTVDRELEQGNTESEMFQFVFEIAYKGVPAEYRDEYSIGRVIESVMNNLKKEGSVYYIFDDSNTLLQGDTKDEAITEELIQIQSQLSPDKSYGYRMTKAEDKYYCLTSARSECDGNVFFLSISKDVTPIYEDRNVLLNQYLLILVLLLTTGAGIIFLLSRYMTEPIRRLTFATRKIAGGDLDKRVENKSEDEIGQLSRSFNEMADKLVDRMQEKELEARQKEDFTAAFAHELKTPLTSIIGYSDMLSTMHLSEAEINEAAYYIFTQGKRLERLSHKLLELVSVDRQQFARTEIQAKELEENLKITMRPIMEQKGINSKFSMEKGKLYGDKDLILSLLYNLLDNAIKAVQPGGFILLKGVRQKDGYEIKVVDNGRGIPREEISRITEAFYMVDKSRARKEGGAGIGMALCQKIISLHEGSLSVDSGQGEGTVMVVFFPGKEKQ